MLTTLQSATTRAIPRWFHPIMIVCSIRLDKASDLRLFDKSSPLCERWETKGIFMKKTALILALAATSFALSGCDKKADEAASAASDAASSAAVAASGAAKAASGAASGAAAAASGAAAGAVSGVAAAASDAADAAKGAASSAKDAAASASDAAKKM